MVSSSLFKALTAVATLASLVVATPLATPEIVATAGFITPDEQSSIVNGRRNAMSLTIENKSDLNVTLVSAASSFHHPETQALIKNGTELKYGVTLISGASTMLPYGFHSETKPQDVLLKVWINVNDGSPSGPFPVMAYESIVPVIEPPKGWFDLPLLFAYLVIGAILGGSGYFVYTANAPQGKKVKKSQVSAPVGKVTASTATGSYEEEWIPAHHLKTAKKVDGAVSSSGDESGPEKRKGKGKPKKA
ncbi:hypothetical protein FRC03_005268 [Tulasnella sp. 419]|nr:hypothetical protein FRC03_005268 [Tulasnella sp. 419]